MAHSGVAGAMVGGSPKRLRRALVELRQDVLTALKDLGSS
jgi:hypothetical protein